MVSISLGSCCVAGIISFRALTNYLHDVVHGLECKGKYFISIVDIKGAERCFLRAHKCYVQWGAVEKADKLWKDWNLDASTESVKSFVNKHGRDE